MSTETILKCDGCGARGFYREGGDMLPKGWGQVRLCPSSSGRWEELDLCHDCFPKVVAAVPRPAPKPE